MLKNSKNTFKNPKKCVEIVKIISWFSVIFSEFLDLFLDLIKLTLIELTCKNPVKIFKKILKLWKIICRLVLTLSVIYKNISFISIDLNIGKKRQPIRCTNLRIQIKSAAESTRLK